MDFTVSCTALKEKLEAYIGAVGSKSSRPELTGFLFWLSQDSNLLHIHATDTEVFLIGEVNVFNVDGFGVFCVPSHLLLKQLRLLPEQPLTFHVDLDSLLVTVDYENGKFSFMGYEANNYPDTPAAQRMKGEFRIPSDELNNALSKVLSSAGTDLLRPILNGVNFDFTEKGLNLVASNGQRLALAGIGIDSETDGCSFVLQSRSVTLLQKQLSREAGDVTLSFDEERVYIAGAGFHMVSRLVGGRFPNYNRVIPGGDPNVRGIDSSWLISAIRRTSCFSMTSQLIKLSVDSGLLSVSGENEDYKTYSTEQLELDYFGPHMEAFFRADFLMDYLYKIGSKKVDLLFSDRGLPVRIEPSEASESLSMRFIVVPSAS